jgi:hypothetical protein
LWLQKRYTYPNTGVAGPDPGSGAFMAPGSRIGKKSRSGSGMNISDHISESLETILWVKILKFFDADPGSGSLLTLDPGWKKFGSGIRDKRSGSTVHN